MTKKEQRQKAKDILRSITGTAYYKMENEDIPESDKEAIMQYINQYGKAACKAFVRICRGACPIRGESTRPNILRFYGSKQNVYSVIYAIML